MEFDVVVIGAGPAGESSAVHATKYGLSVALIERELVGGECPYWGCMPSKALLRPAQARNEAHRVPGAIEQPVPPVDVDAVHQWRDDVTRHLSDESHSSRVEKHGVTIIRGHGRLTGTKKVSVTDDDGNTTTLTAKIGVVLSPGTRASVPPIDGLKETPFWTNREATLAPTPSSIAIIGGGVISVEMAQAWSSLGATVTIIEFVDRILNNEEPQAAALVAKALEQCGVTVLTGVGAERVSHTSSDGFTIHLPDSKTITAEHLLVATGRTANLDDIGLDAIDATTDDRGNLPTSNRLQVAGHDWLYCVGDANGRALLTHAANYQAKIAARNLAGETCYCIEDEFGAPRAVFTEPQIAAVGFTEQAAVEHGLRVKSFDRDPQRTAAGSFYGRGTEGFARLVVDLDAQRIVGATLCGVDIADQLQAATIAIVGSVPLERLQHCVAPFPTRSEVWTAWTEQLAHDDDID